MKKKFRPHHHIPRFSYVLIASLRTPLLMYFAVAGNLVMFSGAYIFMHLEMGVNPKVLTYADSLWWALCTISTVGYGDIVPHTNGGRVVAAFLIIVGVTFFVSFMAALVSVMSTVVAEEEINKD